MNKIELFEHNEIAYEKLSQLLSTSQMGTINHATGTGKSFIALKYLYDNRDKKILYLSPTYPIFTQLVKTHMKKLNIDINDFHTFDHMIYRSLLGIDMKKLAENYDIIVLDEYHRCGAKEWGKKVVELLEIIKKKYPDHKVIGLTATEKRYLDNERDMNQELFDGSCASTLTLADAIIRGILPSPVYINTMLNCKEKVEELRRLIEQKIYYVEDKEKFLTILDDLDKYVEKCTKIEDIFTPYIKSRNGKYIVFNSTINSISQNKKKVTKWLKKYNITNYEIHSLKSQEKNEKTLENFRNAKDGINILYVVDILNEGIHVDDIDGIMMMRHTTSPIIYFQQLGRLLSYSGRNDELVVWDLVDNLKSHKVIYNLYQDVKERAKQLIIEDTQNAERYKTILDRFKIIDSATEIMIRIDRIEQLLNEENIIDMRLNTAIKILNDPYHKNQQERIQAHIDIFKFSKFISLEMFEKIEGLNIIKPDELSVSSDEFRTNLAGFSCLHEKSEEENINLVKEFERFSKTNQRVPSIFSDNEEEVLLARKVVSNMEKLSGKLRKRINNLVGKDLSLSAYERVYYGKKIGENRYSEFFDELNKHFTDETMLSKNIIRFLKEIQNSKTFDVVYFLDKIQEKEQTSKKNKRVDTLETRIIEFSKEHDGKFPTYNPNNIEEQQLYLEFNCRSEGYKNRCKQNVEKDKYGIASLMTEEEQRKATEEYAEELLKFINSKFRYPVHYLEIEKDEYSKYRAFSKTLSKFGFKEKLDELVKMKKREQLENSKNLFIPELLAFIQNNYGDLPSMKIEDEDEQRLAKEFRRFKRYFSDIDRKIISDEIKNVKDNLETNVVESYVNFLLKNKRHPLETSENEEERELVRRYKRNADNFTPQDTGRIKRVYGQIHKRDVLKNTYQEMMSNNKKIK